MTAFASLHTCTLVCVHTPPSLAGLATAICCLSIVHPHCSCHGSSALAGVLMTAMCPGFRCTYLVCLLPTMYFDICHICSALADLSMTTTCFVYMHWYAYSPGLIIATCLQYTCRLQYTPCCLACHQLLHVHALACIQCL